MAERTYLINKHFSTEVERTERVLEIAEAFGLGLDEKDFVVFDNLELKLRDGDVIYITGQSGSGKSTILNELKKLMTQDGLKVADIDKTLMTDQPIIDQLCPTVSEALQIFSLVGLSDANLYLRKPKELSDGQRYRLKLAKLIESGAQVWFADEFLAVLDRVTAKNIAFNLQKIARKCGATLIVATTHTDLVDDLAPDIYILKRYRERIDIQNVHDDEYKKVESEFDDK
ncbi:ATP-binding cassette domain-containing protein [Parasutterella muris]|uniref:ATP-binding cassette domain-containing protein n=1 Tax=Parasutterella muris TaxID=2565572 RepID=A0A6L6YMJ0_9BURK|nr:ATP-binding cassette domain-containing protein [Parasutterella muris]MVX56411.1 ATP-binding cassette domain-containing protein [Parasutterella muris]